MKARVKARVWRILAIFKVTLGTAGVLFNGNRTFRSLPDIRKKRGQKQRLAFICHSSFFP